MNLRLFSIAVLISALPMSAMAGASAGTAQLRLNHGDFTAGEKTTREGETLVSVKLSKSGRAKMKKLSAETVLK